MNDITKTFLVITAAIMVFILGVSGFIQSKKDENIFDIIKKEHNYSIIMEKNTHILYIDKKHKNITVMLDENGLPLTFEKWEALNGIAKFTNPISTNLDKEEQKG